MDLPDNLDAGSLRLVTYPHPVLAERAAPVEGPDPRLADVVARMFEVMHAARGVGLAAPQLGLSIRVFVANATSQPEGDAVYVNPEIVSRQGQVMQEEGCLSCPGINCRIKRSAVVTLRATGLDGREFEQTADDLLARVFQHETDHLDGTLILDRMSAVARLANRRTIRDLEADYADQAPAP